MIGIRVMCDAEDCRQHFEASGDELSPVPTLAREPAPARAGLCFVGVLAFPAGWSVVEEHPGIVRALCSTHAAQVRADEELRRAQAA